MDTSPQPSFSLATFNMHAGADGWGRPYDVVAACRTLDADVLVLEENWIPDGRPGVAATVGEALGYTVFEQSFASGRLAGPHPRANRRWMKPFDWRGTSHAIYLDSELPLGARIVNSRRFIDAERGQWGVAILSRLPARRRDVIDMGRLSPDRARRFALVVEIDVAGVPVTVIGTHMSHILYGAPKQFLRLNRAIGRMELSGPGVLAGDMNMWGPPTTAFFRGWRRAVRRRTWPSWRPHSQVDHILVRGPVAVEATRSLPSLGSDHLPLWVRLAVQDG